MYQFVYIMLQHPDYTHGLSITTNPATIPKYNTGLLCFSFNTHSCKRRKKDTHNKRFLLRKSLRKWRTPRLNSHKQKQSKPVRGGEKKLFPTAAWPGSFHFDPNEAAVAQISAPDRHMQCKGNHHIYIFFLTVPEIQDTSGVPKMDDLILHSHRGDGGG